MALNLPTADALLAGVALSNKKAAAAAADPYDALTPEQQAEVDARTELDLHPRSGLGEVGAGFVRGIKYELPKMIGSALQATGKEGDFLHGVGSSIEKAVAPNDYLYALDPEHHGAVVNALAGGAAMVAPSLSGSAAMLIPGVGPAGAAAAGGALFGASQFQDTYEKAKKAGKTDAEAFSAGLETGAIEAGGETLGTYAGVKLITGAGKAFLRGATAEGAYQAIKNPKLMLPLIQDIAKTAAVEVGTEMGQAAGEAAVEQAHGLPTPTPWDAATAAIGPTLGMTALMGPLAALGLRGRQNAQRHSMDALDKVMEDPKSSLMDRVRASKEQAGIIAEETGDTAGAQEWRLDRLAEANATAMAGIAAENRDAASKRILDTLNTPVVGPEQPMPSIVQQYIEQGRLSQEHADILAQRRGALPVSDRGTSILLDQMDADARARAIAQQTDQDFAKRTGSATANEGAIAAIQAAAATPTEQVVPNQGTAQMLGLARGPSTIPTEKVGPTVNLSRNKRVEMLRKAAPTLPAKWLNELTGLDSGQLPSALQEIWHTVGGEQGPKYAASIEALYTQLTGRDIREVQQGPTISDRPAFSLEAPTAATVEQQRVQEADAQNAAAEDKAAQDYVQNLHVKSRMGDLVSGKPTPTTKESRAREAQVKFQNAVSALKAAFEGFDNETASQAPAQVDQGTQPQPAPVQAQPVAAARPAEGGETNRDAQPAAQAKDVAPKAQARARAAKAENNVKDAEAALKAAQAELDSAARSGKATKAQAKKVEQAQKSLETAQKNGGRAIHGNIKGAVSAAQRLIQNFEDGRKRIITILAQHIANKRNMDSWHKLPAEWKAPEPTENMPITAQDRKRAEMLMGKKDEWVYSDDWVDRVVGKELGLKFTESFKKEARVVEADTLGKGKDLAKEDEEAAAAMEAQTQKERAFAKKEALRDAETDPFDSEVDPDTLKSVSDQQAPQPNVDSEVYTQLLVSEAGTVGAAMKAVRSAMTPVQQALMDVLMKIPGVAAVELRLKGYHEFERGYYMMNPADRHVGIRNTASINTLLHEAVHVATHSAIEKGGQNLVRMQKVFQAAMLALQDHPEFQGAHPFKNIHEFVAEAYTNPAFQKFLSKVDVVASTPTSSTLWDKFKDAVRGLLGLNKRTLLNEVFDAGGTLFSGPQATDVDGFAHQSIGATFDSIKNVVQGLGKDMPQWIQHLPSKTRQTLLGLATAGHIKDWVANSPTLVHMKEQVADFFRHYDTKTRMIQDSRQEFYAFLRRVELKLHSMKDKGGYAENSARMQELGGEMSRMNVDLDKSWAANVQANPQLTQADAVAFNRLQNKWKALDPELQGFVREGVKLNRKYYVMNTAAVMFNMLGTHVTAHQNPLIQQMQSRLDLLKNDVATNAPIVDALHLDARSKHYADQLEATFADAKALPETDEVRKAVQFIERFYRAAVKNPYLHLGRDGNFYAAFNVHVDKANAAGKGADSTVLGELAAKYKAVVGDVSKDNNHVFLRFETMQQMQQFRADATKLGLVDGDAQSGRINDKGVLNNAAGVPQAIRLMVDKMDTLVDGMPEKVRDELRAGMTRIFIEALPESSPQKANAQRKNGGIPGYEADFVHSFAKRAEGMSSSIANSYTMPHFDQALRDMKDKIAELEQSQDNVAQEQSQEVFMELAQRFSNSINPVESPAIDAAKALGYNFYLALSPAFMLVNTLQPYHLSLPVMGGRHGFVATAKAMGKAAGISMKLLHDTYVKGWGEGKFTGIVDAELLTSKLDPAHADMVTALMQLGRLDFTQAHELGRMASGGSHGWALAAKVASLGSHITEINNRLTTAIAAFDLEMQKTKAGESAEQRTQRAIDYAVKTVDATQFNYADHNTARYLGRHGAFGAVTPLLASFQQFSFQSMELLARLTRDAFMKINERPGMTKEEVKAMRDGARTALAGLTATTSFLCGVLGLPFANVIAAAVDAAGGSDDDPMDIKIAIRNWLANIFGKDLGEVIARGVPRAVGIDISQRAGLQDVLPGSRFLTDKREFADKVKGGALSAFGPAVNAAVDMGIMASHLSNGDLMGALTLGLPLALRNPAKAIEAANHGYTTKTGNEIPLNVTSWDIMNQTLGFTPAKKAEQSEANFAYKTRDAQIKKHMGRVANDLYTAVERGGDTSKEVAAFREAAQKNPTYAGKPAAALESRAKAREVARQSGTGVVAPTKQLPTINDKYKFANTGI